MAHHGRVPSADLDAIFGKPKPALGPTGAFPHGKLVLHDEGEIQLAVGQKDGKVVIDFGEPIAWVGMTPQQANDFGELLIQHAREIRLRG